MYVSSRPPRLFVTPNDTIVLFKCYFSKFSDCLFISLYALLAYIYKHAFILFILLFYLDIYMLCFTFIYSSRLAWGINFVFSYVMRNT